MTDQLNATRYHRLFERLGDARARALMDKLQVVALTSPETLGELEAFLDRSTGAETVGRAATADSKRDPRDRD